MATFTFTREQLVAAFGRWEQDREDGKCLSDDEARSGPLGERAESSADALIRYLGGGDDFPLGKACDLTGDGTCEACQ